MLNPLFPNDPTDYEPQFPHPFPDVILPDVPSNLDDEEDDED